VLAGNNLRASESQTIHLMCFAKGLWSIKARFLLDLGGTNLRMELQLMELW
jgi:hypothetical protein